VGKAVTFEDGTLRVLEVHDPCAFLVRECLSADRQHVRPVPGTRYVSVKFQFTCSPQQVVCETVPEASLELLLEDGRRIEDDWCFGVAPRLGEEDVAAGRSVQGWRAFRVADDGEISSLMIDPWEGPTLYAALPTALHGYEVSHDWIEVESGRLQIVPALRRDLEDAKLDVGVTARILTKDGERGLQAQICEESSVYFDEEKALDDHAQVALGVARLAAKHRLQDEMLLLRFGDCSPFSFTEVQIAFRSEDLHMWEVGSYRDNELLQRAFVIVE
jgi:hypothetical protein